MAAIAEKLAEHADTEASRLMPPPGAAARAKALATHVLSGVAIRAFGVMGEPMAKLMNPRVSRDPYEFYADMQRRSPVFRGKRIPLWMVTSWDLAHGVTRDPRFGVDNRLLSTYTEPVFNEGDPRADLPLDHETMLRMDPPDHTRVRKLVSRAFTPRTIESWRPKISRIAHELIDDVASSGEMDLAVDYAANLPILVICELLGVPAEDYESFRHWGDDMAKTLGFRITPAEQHAAMRSNLALSRYFERLFVERRSQPRDDLISALLAAEEDGEVLTHRELLATCVLILVAGFETTVNLISNGTNALLANPDQLELLRSRPDIAENAVDELLRYDCPVQFTSRNAREDVELAGQTIKKGDQVGVMIGAANNDPSVFESPRRLDLERHNAGQHIAFSSGPHFCLGAALARLEGQVAFAVLLERLRDIRPAGRFVRRRNELLRGFEHLPIAFKLA